ncbi:MAG: (2Fe-2S)-binding protein [Hyphomicrobiales bacterium]|nr:MAG: (2Fe-2S)-binding protein [Hyphomicrobiales bacterium]
MPRITYIAHDGTKTEVEAPEGWTLMQAATLNNVAGIEGECGGSCACATCHVYVDDAWLDKVGAMAEAENDMLEFTVSTRTANSRLGCQIKVSGSLDGLVVRLPEEQS